jgi:hypothetical protein
VDIASALEPSLPKGAAGATRGKGYIVEYNTAKMTRVLGLQPRSKEECVRDSVEYFKSLPGAWPPASS